MCWNWKKLYPGGFLLFCLWSVFDYERVKGIAYKKWCTSNVIFLFWRFPRRLLCRVVMLLIFHKDRNDTDVLYCKSSNNAHKEQFKPGGLHRCCVLGWLFQDEGIGGHQGIIGSYNLTFIRLRQCVSENSGWSGSHRRLRSRWCASHIGMLGWTGSITGQTCQAGLAESYEEQSS